MADNMLTIGMDLGGTNIKAGLVSVEGKILEEKEVATEVRDGVDHVLNRMAGVIRDLAKTANRARVKGAGIGLAGQINIKRGIYHSGPNFPGWSNVPVALELEKRGGVPVVIDNDANLAALGEYAFGAGRGITEMLLLTLGTGVGGGLILNGQLYHGASDLAGEVGHASIDPDGPVCACGRKGCLEAFVGTKGILLRLKQKMDGGAESVLRKKVFESIVPKDIAMAAEQGDRIAIEVLHETGDILGFGLANFADILNIERIVIGGGVANAGDLILQPAREAFRREALKVVADACTIVKAELGNTAGLVGAARSAMIAFSTA